MSKIELYGQKEIHLTMAKKSLVKLRLVSKLNEDMYDLSICTRRRLANGIDDSNFPDIRKITISKVTRDANGNPTETEMSINSDPAQGSDASCKNLTFRSGKVSPNDEIVIRIELDENVGDRDAIILSPSDQAGYIIAADNLRSSNPIGLLAFASTSPESVSSRRLLTLATQDKYARPVIAAIVRERGIKAFMGIVAEVTGTSPEAVIRTVGKRPGKNA